MSRALDDVDALDARRAWRGATGPAIERRDDVRRWRRGGRDRKAHAARWTRSTGSAPGRCTRASDPAVTTTPSAVIRPDRFARRHEAEELARYRARDRRAGSGRRPAPLVPAGQVPLAGRQDAPTIRLAAAPRCALHRRAAASMFGGSSPGRRDPRHVARRAPSANVVKQIVGQPELRTVRSGPRWHGATTSTSPQLEPGRCGPSRSRRSRHRTRRRSAASPVTASKSCGFDELGRARRQDGAHLDALS